MANKVSFIKDNLGGLVFSIVIVVFSDIVMAYNMEYGAGKYVALSILHIPAVFIAWVIGNMIRKAIHPDFLVTSGFFSLLKEKIFWRIGPQVILALIIFGIVVNITEASVNTENIAADRAANPSSIANAKKNDDTDTVLPASGIAPEFLELSKAEFIRMTAGDNPLVETDVSRLGTMIKRGNKYLKVTGTMTDEYDLWDIFDAVTNIPEPVAVLDLSAVQGWDNVESIRSGGLSFFLNIEAIVFGDALTRIPYRFFWECINLKAVYLPDGITSIGSDAFQGSGITEIVIPPSVTEIRDTAFRNCYSLRYIYFSENSRLTGIEHYTFYGCKSLYSISIPAYVKTIGGKAFDEASLENVTITADSQLETVEDGAFANTNIASFTFPKTIKEIGRDIFGEQITSVVIMAVTPPKVTSYTFPKTIQSIYVPAESLKVYEDAWFDYEFTFNNQLKALP